MRILTNIVAIAMTMFVSAAYGGEPAIDFSSPILGMNGEPFMECREMDEATRKCKHSSPLLLGELCKTALDMVVGDTKSQVASFRIMEALAHGRKVDFSREEKSAIIAAIWEFRKRRAEDMRSPYVVPLEQIGGAIKMIDPDSLKSDAAR